MEEIVFWKEVDVKDATNSIKISDEVFGGIVFVKRVVIPILSDQEIEKKVDEIRDTIDFDKTEMYPVNAYCNKICTALYKAMQERLIQQ